MSEIAAEGASPFLQKSGKRSSVRSSPPPVRLWARWQARRWSFEPCPGDQVVIQREISGGAPIHLGDRGLRGSHFSGRHRRGPRQAHASPRRDRSGRTIDPRLCGGNRQRSRRPSQGSAAGAPYHFTFSLPKVVDVEDFQPPPVPDCLVVAFNCDSGEFALELFLKLYSD